MPIQEGATALLAYELRETVGRVIRRLRAEPGPPVGQLVVLSRLDRQGPASISELAVANHVRPQSMAQTVHELEAAGLVSRRPDPADGRRAFVELTPAGLEAVADTRLRREDWLTRALDGELDERERDLVRKALPLLDRVAGA